MRVANEGPLEVSCEKNTCSCGPDATYPKHIFHRSLTREKALIAAGQKEIADMTEGLKEQLQQTATAMEKQGEIQGDSHDEILADLAKIREQVRRRVGWMNVEKTNSQIERIER